MTTNIDVTWAVIAVAAINSVIGSVVLFMLFYLKDSFHKLNVSYLEIQHSVNADRDRMIEKLDSMESVIKQFEVLAAVADALKKEQQAREKKETP